MNDESTNIFKVFRVLWFPMSSNAVALGAIASGLFYLVTWAVIELGYPEETIVTAESAVRDFLTRCWTAVRYLHWPETASHARWLFVWQILAFFFLWSTFGVAICRILALRVAKDEYLPLGEAWAFAWRVKLTGMLYPVAILLPIVVITALNMVAGAVGSIPLVGWFLGLFALPLVLVSTIIIILLAVSGIVAVGMIPGAIAIERKGTYDSLGKAINYIFARPLLLILYLILIGAFLNVVYELFLGMGLVKTFLVGTLTPFYESRYDDVALGLTGTTDGWQKACAWLHGVVWTVFDFLVYGALVSYALGAFTSMFLVFRQDVDGIEYGEIARDTAEPPPPVTPEGATT